MVTVHQAISSACLEKIATRLLPGRIYLDHIDILPHYNANNADGYEANTSDGHQSLNVTVGLNSSITDGATDGILKLDVDITIDGLGKVLCIIRQILVQLDREDVGPQGAGQSVSDGRANGAEESEEGNTHGQFLMANCCHDSKLRCQGPDSTIEAIEDLNHDQNTDMGSRSSKPDQQRRTQHCKWRESERKVLEGSKIADNPMTC